MVKRVTLVFIGFVFIFAVDPTRLPAISIADILSGLSQAIPIVGNGVSDVIQRIDNARSNRLTNDTKTQIATEIQGEKNRLAQQLDQFKTSVRNQFNSEIDKINYIKTLNNNCIDLYIIIENIEAIRGIDYNEVKTSGNVPLKLHLARQLNLKWDKFSEKYREVQNTFINPETPPTELEGALNINFRLCLRNVKDGYEQIEIVTSPINTTLLESTPGTSAGELYNPGNLTQEKINVINNVVNRFATELVITNLQSMKINLKQIIDISQLYLDLLMKNLSDDVRAL